MRVLFVEDNADKKAEILALLRKYGLDNFCMNDNTRDCYYAATDCDYDLFICDMDLPRNGSFPIVEDELEGLNLMKELMRKRIFIPTIIFSPLEVSKDKLSQLKNAGYPLIGHAKSATELDQCMEEKFFDPVDESVEAYLALAKVQPRFRRSERFTDK